MIPAVAALSYPSADENDNFLLSPLVQSSPLDPILSHLYGPNNANINMHSLHFRRRLDPLMSERRSHARSVSTTNYGRWTMMHQLSTPRVLRPRCKLPPRRSIWKRVRLQQRMKSRHSCLDPVRRCRRSSASISRIREIMFLPWLSHTRRPLVPPA